MKLGEVTTSVKRVLAFLLSITMLLSTVTLSFADEGTGIPSGEGTPETVIEETENVGATGTESSTGTDNTKPEEQNMQNLQEESSTEVGEPDTVSTSDSTNVEEASGDGVVTQTVPDNIVSRGEEEATQNNVTENTEDVTENSDDGSTEVEAPKSF